MQHAPLLSVPKHLLECASSLNDDELVPVRVPASTFAFINHLGSQCDHSTKPLGRFLLTVPSCQLRNAILGVIASDDYQAIRDELEQRQREKEDAVANQDWERAVALRDKTDGLNSRLRQMAQERTELQPEHILQAIADLGFNEPLTV